MSKAPKTPSTKKKNVQVVVRSRPLSEAERLDRYKSIVACDSVAKTVTMKNLPGTDKQKTFGPFDKVYGPEARQIDLYNDIVTPMVKEVLNGYNCTVFAYGQTGSGKTFTMEGHHDEENEHSWETDPTSGIIPRALHHIFSLLGDQELDYYTVRVSYVEMYNEQIYDLLSRSENSHQESLRIFDDKNKGVSIVGMEEVAVRSREEVYALLKRGAEKRRTAATLMNISSSRSHSVFTVTVMMREPGVVDGEELLRQGKLNLVDLAGSENIGRSGATDKRAREAGNINVSLLALGRVINSLTMNAQHIPYRESKLTRILQDSLGGKTITTIIATLSPASSNYEESVNTLDYAQRAKNIKNNPEVNQKITRKALLREYNEEIERLRRDLVAVREKTGIYIDKENYENMLETMDENKTKIEELEGLLEAKLHQVNILFEDLTIMDEQYQTVYQKCQQAINKLEFRKNEVENLNKQLIKNQDNLKAANRALSHSTNAFVRLRSQAFKLQECCTIYYDDLDALHKRLNVLKETSTENDRLLGQFTAERISEVTKAKSDINDYVNSTQELLHKTDDASSTICEQTKTQQNVLQKNFKWIDECVNKFGDNVSESLASFNESKNALNKKFSPLFSANIEKARNFTNQASAGNQSTIETSTETISDVKLYEEIVLAQLHKIERVNKKNDEKFTTLVNAIQNSIQELVKNQIESTKANDEFTAKLEKEVKRTNLSIIQKSTQICDTQKLGQANLQGVHATLNEHEQVHNDFQAQALIKDEEFCGNVSAMKDEMILRCQGFVSTLGMTSNEFAQFLADNFRTIVSSTNQQKDSTKQFSESLVSSLTHSQLCTERFIHQEFKRVQSTGQTPIRRPANFNDDEIIDIPAADELIRQQELMATPRRSSIYHVRDSLLESDLKNKMISPMTLKSTLAGKQLNSVPEYPPTIPSMSSCTAEESDEN